MGQLTITLAAVEWASVQPDGTLWLAREGRVLDRCDHKYYSCDEVGCDGSGVPLPPVEFVQACAPCDTCGDHRELTICEACGAHTEQGTCANCGGFQTMCPAPCPDCRIELVGPCWDHDTHMAGFPCQSLTLGHAYAIGQPLPIITQPPHHRLGWPKHTFIGAEGGRFWLRSFTAPAMWEPTDLTAALAHYGPPETLVGRWVMQLRVVQP